jgi:hypothetical protein
LTAFIEHPKSLTEGEEKAGEPPGVDEGLMSEVQEREEGAPRTSAMGEEDEKERRTAGLKNQSCEGREGELEKREEKKEESHQQLRLLRLRIFEDESMTSMRLTDLEHLSREEAGEAVPRRLNLARRDGLTGEAAQGVSGVLEEAEGRRSSV